MLSGSLITGFHEQVKRSPEAAALVWDDDIVPYGRLGADVADMRGQLREMAPGRHRPVAVQASRSPATVALILACLTEGRPVLLAPPELGVDSLHEVVARVGADRVLNRAATGDVAVDAVTPRSDASELPRGVRLLLTTSGTTGLPKVVPLPAAGVDAFVKWAADRFGIGPGRSVLSYAPLNFDLSLLEVWTTLGSGGCAVLVPPDRATDGAHLRELIDRHEIHLVQGVPLMYRQLCDGGRDDEALKTPRHVLFTGAAMPSTLIRRLPTLFPAATFANVYGCTETNDSFIHDTDLAGWDEASVMPIGQPIPGVRARLEDPEGQPLTGCGVGELVVCTPFQAPGYVGAAPGRPAFVTRHDDDGPHTYFRSGDLLRRHPDGTLTLVGRCDFQVKVRGTRVNTEEVEQVLLSHPDVREAAVLALPDEAAGHRLSAVVRRAPGSPLGTIALRRHCASRLTRAAIPSQVQITDDPLPRGSTGKIDRAALARASE
ncbi:AMP-binding protein [Solwaraspora sp. WMMD1047]|uniref:AMP-binding protein n=1 Tax=Solwaraspora sp. WMMD1047 TaxID=3016102 RepID=UPI0024167AAF|nr:AMP-binding protein [Solwaraspora sp. WMMD1047]MDG4830633.1 AMP-binding protein [Solwaraspora sp. WMMD1047]